MNRKRMVAAVCLLCASLAGCGTKASRSIDSLILAIGEVDASCGPVVEYVRKEYEQLSDEEKASLENYPVLLAAEAAYVDALIDKIGAVTPESMGAIEAAENAYAALHDDAKSLVTGADDLKSAREICDLETLRRRFSGVWVNEVLGSGTQQIGRGLIRSYGLDETNCNPVSAESSSFELREDGILLYAGEETGTWELSEDRTEVILHTASDGASSPLKILEEGGYPKLAGAVFGNAAFGYVKEADYAAAFHTKFVAAEVNRENIHDYIADPVKIGTLTHENGKNYKAYVYPSQVYEDGLIYLGSSCIIQVDYNHGGKKDHFWLEYPALSITRLKMKDVKIDTEAHLSGEIYYIREEYVADNYINGEGFRVVELTNGATLVFDGYTNTLDTYWGRVDAAYSDYMY